MKSVICNLLILPFVVFLQHHDLDIETKSYRGWSRIINSETRRDTYKFNLSRKEIDLYTKELKKLSQEKTTSGKLKWEIL